MTKKKLKPKTRWEHLEDIAPDALFRDEDGDHNDDFDQCVQVIAGEACDTPVATRTRVLRYLLVFIDKYGETRLTASDSLGVMAAAAEHVLNDAGSELAVYDLDTGKQVEYRLRFYFPVSDNVPV